MAFSRLFGKSKKDPPSPSGELISSIIDTLSSPDKSPVLMKEVLFTFNLVLYYPFLIVTTFLAKVTRTLLLELQQNSLFVV
jgi:hypothetical protein